MADVLSSPYVQVRVDKVVLRPGQTLTIYAHNPDGMREQIEVRSVGVRGATVGQPEIFFDSDVVVCRSFDDWRPMDQQQRWYRGLPLDPQPAKK